ncbi:MAG: prepilin peptidase [Elusimicrobiota bacterium]
MVILHITIIIFLGLAFGSFANVLICRLPYNKPYMFSRSECAHCGKKLGALDLVPIVSYLFLKGRCKYCGSGISLLYPVSEIVMVLLFFVPYLMHGISIQSGIEAVLLFFIYTMTVIDFKHQILPDELTVGMIIFGLLVSLVNPLPGKQGLTAVLYSFAGLLWGGLVMWIIALFGEKVFKQEALGGGDIKYMAGIGSVFGFSSVVFVLFYSSLAASVAGITLIITGQKSRKDKMAFGPFMSIGVLIYLYAGKYLAFFG